MKTSNFFFFILFNLLLFTSIILFNNEYRPEHFTFVYSLQFISFILLTLTVKDIPKFLLSPSSLCFLYIILNEILGSYAYYKGWVLNVKSLNDYHAWKYSTLSTCYFLVCGCISILAYPVSHMRISNADFIQHHSMNTSNIDSKNYFIVISVILIFSIIIQQVSTSIFSGLIIIPVSMFFNFIVYLLVVNKIKYRIIYYTLFLILFSFYSYNDKRNVILFIFSILIIELSINNIKITLKTFLIGAFILLLLLLLIITMSMLRGYGSYEIDSIFSVVYFIPKYITNENFIKLFLGNLELSAHFFYSHKAVELIQDDFSLLSFGSTILKAIYIVLPSNFIEIKPDSIIDLFTKAYDPAFRSIGGSLPINIYSEMFWNFHFYGIIPLLLILIIFNKIFFIATKLVKYDRIYEYFFIIFMYQELLIYFRGSGLDVYTAYVAVAFCLNISTITIINFLKLSRICRYD